MRGRCLQRRRPHAGRRRGRPLVGATIVVGLLLSVMAVWGRSVAAFSGSAGTTGSWSVATVTLTDDDSESASIDVTALGGESGSACIQVVYAGTIPAQVTMYSANGSDTGGLGARVRLWIEEGAGGTSSGCDSFVPTRMLFSGTLGSLITGVNGYGSGLGSWTGDPGASSTRSYRFTWALDPASGEELVDTSVSATITWESRQS